MKTHSVPTAVRACISASLAATALVPAILITNTALAADASAGDSSALEEVIVTGSAIKRTDAETAVPLTVVKVEDLRKEGLTTVEQVLNTLSSNQPNIGTSQAVGSSTGGASFADLRGIGPNKTLVLLNGRRIANNAFDGSAPDMNSVPMAAIERIEVLRDGASSLYGTDAIGGVINFITKQSFQGVSASIGYDKPQHPGGVTKSANIGGGFGDLQTQGFNIFAFADFQKQDNISGTQRDFNTRFAGGLSPTPIPANFFQGDGSLFGNPIGPDCVGGDFTIPAGDGSSCYMTTSSYVDYIPESQRASGYLKGEFQLNENNTLTAEYFITRSEVKTLIAPVPYGLTAQNPFLPDGVTPNPYYPGNSGNSFSPNIPLDPGYDGSAYAGDWTSDYGCTFGIDCTLAGVGLTSGRGVNNPLLPGFVWVKWRDTPNGPRGDDNITLQQRATLSLQGAAGNWDYGGGLAYNRTKTDEHLISGYGDGDLLNEGILDGIINPYGEQDAAGTAYIDSALLKGLVLFGTGTLTTVDAHVSNTRLGDWLNAGRQAAAAFGIEYRHEKFTQQANHDYAQLVETSTGIDPDTYNAGSRNIYAAYAELNIPLHNTLDMTLAGRFDKYSDFGTTTNPKLSFRWQPIRNLVVRSAASTGFRAPSLYELYSTQAYTNTSQIADPLSCPGGKGTGSNAAPDFCSAQFVALLGGNTDLKPEKSKSFTLGFVAEPAARLSVGADYWFIQVKDQIFGLPEATLLDPANQSWATQYIHRDRNNRLSIVTQLCPGANCGYVDERNQNPGGVLTDGVDFNAEYRIPTDVGSFNLTYNSTWVRRYNYQDFPSGPWNRNVGAYVGSTPVFRWKHVLGASWTRDAFSAGAILHHKNGYIDDPNGELPDNIVSSYTTVDIFGGWRPVKSLNVVLGIRNLMDKAPPLSGQLNTFQAGYDPRFYDPTGRVFYGRVSYDLNF